MSYVAIAIQIKDFECRIEDVGELLKLSPTEAYYKGEKYYLGSKGQIEKVQPWNFWEYRMIIRHNEVWIQTLINVFIRDLIRPRKEVLAELAKSANLCLFVYMEGIDQGRDGFHFSLPELALLAELKIELDIDLYCK